MHNGTFAIFDRTGLLENGYFTEGEALQAAEKYFPGEDTYVKEVHPEPHDDPQRKQ